MKRRDENNSVVYMKNAFEINMVPKMIHILLKFAKTPLLYRIECRRRTFQIILHHYLKMNILLPDRIWIFLDFQKYQKGYMNESS